MLWFLQFKQILLTFDMETQTFSCDKTYCVVTNGKITFLGYFVEQHENGACVFRCANNSCTIHNIKENRVVESSFVDATLMPHVTTAEKVIKTNDNVYELEKIQKTTHESIFNMQNICEQLPTCNKFNVPHVVDIEKILNYDDIYCNGL